MKSKLIKLPFLACISLLSLTSIPDGEEVLSGRLPRPESGRGCTSFYLNGGDGGGYYGTNFDNDYARGQLFVNKRGIEKSGLESSSTGNKARWTSKYGSLTFNLVGYQLPWAGMNEAGLVISTMALAGSEAPGEDERPPLISPLWVQFILDTCGSVEDVLDQGRRVRIRDTVDHFMTADKAGNCAVIEFIAGRMVIHSGKNLPVLVLTNNIYDYAVLAWKEHRAQGESLRRFVAAAEKVKDFVPLGTKPSEEYAFSILSLTANRLLTKWSVVFDQKDLRVSYFTAQNPGLRNIDLKKTDFSAGTPVRMLDIDAGGTCDAASTLETYSHDEAFSHMADAFKVFAPALPESQVWGMLAFFEHFQPASPAPLGHLYYK